MRYWSIAILVGLGAGQIMDGRAAPPLPGTVVLHVTVMDKQLKPTATLGCGDFKIFEDNQEQKLKDCRQEDVPVSAGILVDSSGSMRDKAGFVNSAVSGLVKASHPQSEFFLVNFNNERYLDSDFTRDPSKIGEALGKWSARGGTAFYDALISALDHLQKRALNSKRVIVVVGDGEDNMSRSTQEQALASSRASEAVVYAIGVPNAKRLDGKGGRQVLGALAEATGGAAVFPSDTGEAEAMAAHIAAYIRNQYLMSYVPANQNVDGKFRKIRVVVESKGRDKLTVRTRTGYYR